jgi:protein disulfide-isomerase
LKSAALEWIDKQDTAFQLERQELRDAKQLRIEEAEDKDNERALRDAKNIRINMDDIPRTQVGFAWVDGIFWERWIRTTYGVDVKDGESVIINDEDVSHQDLSYMKLANICRTAVIGTALYLVSLFVYLALQS